MHAPRTMRRPLLALTALLLLPVPAHAQQGDREPGAVSDAVRDELMARFDGAMQQFIALAEAMPPESYTWAPSEEVMPVGQVYMHVARYNYLYPSQNMRAAAVPADVDMESMEAVRDKQVVVAALRESGAWVREAVGGLTSADMEEEVELYGRDVPQWAVLVQLVTHMNQHLGQAIAYARMNDVVPPWSR